MNMLDYGLIGEQIPPSVGLILQPHEATTTRIYFGCSEEQKERYLPDLMSGAAYRLHGQHRARCRLRPAWDQDPRHQFGDELIINGSKLWISNAPICDVMNVTCRLTAADGKSSVVRVLVDRSEFRFFDKGAGHARPATGAFG